MPLLPIENAIFDIICQISPFQSQKPRLFETEAPGSGHKKKNKTAGVYPLPCPLKEGKKNDNEQPPRSVDTVVRIIIR